MDEWMAHGADFVETLAQRDPVFHGLRQELEVLTPAFDRLLEALPEDDRELILEYLNLQTDMEARKTFLAWMYK